MSLVRNMQLLISDVDQDHIHIIASSGRAPTPMYRHIVVHIVCGKIFYTNLECGDESLRVARFSVLCGSYILAKEIHAVRIQGVGMGMGS